MVESIPASHRNDLLPLPMPPALVGYQLDSAMPVDNALEYLEEWCNKDDSNLAVILGSYGTAKTAILKNLASHLETETWEVHQIDFHTINWHLNEGGDPLAERIQSGGSGRRHAVLIDNFDGVSLLDGRQYPDPDVRQIRGILGDNAKVAVFTRRTTVSTSDQLFRQIASPKPMLQELELTEPIVVSLQPWSLEQIRIAFTSSDDESLHRAYRILAVQSDLTSAHLRRPLWLTMLVAIALKLDDEQDEISPSRLFGEFTKVLLGADFDNGKSWIDEGYKRHILTNLAFDICSGTSGTDEGQDPPTTRSVSIGRIGTRIMDQVSALGSTIRLAHGNRSVRQHDFTHDFLATCHALVPSLEPENTVSRTKYFEFANPTLYEYFLAQAILDRVGANKSLGLPYEMFTKSTFDSLALHFVRDALTPQTISALTGLALRDKLDWPDRLLFLYLLEDQANFADILNQVPSEYIPSIENVIGDEPDFFLKKVISYQLVVLGMMSPYDYIEMVKEFEEDEHLLAEAHLQSEAGDTTMFLLSRVANPSLQRCRPITLFRLGQLADARALPILKNLDLTVVDDDPRFSELVVQTIQAIELRTVGEV